MTKSNSLNGMKTSVWGPHAWTFLFCSVIGAYPIKIDEKNKEHLKIKKHFKNMFMSLGYTMPCVFCRQSYRVFIQEMPIDAAMGSRAAMTRWLYNLKDKVNKKLIKQELECYKSEYDVALTLYNNKKISKDKYNEKIKELKRTILVTKPSVPFATVCSKYEKYRAGCSEKSKKCA